MKKQITRFSPHQTAKVFALIYIVFTLPFLVIGLIALIFGGSIMGPGSHPGARFSVFFFILAPFLYGAMGYLFTLLGSVIYNAIAKHVGGIEVTVSDIADTD